MKLLIGTMFFTMLACAALTLPAIRPRAARVAGADDPGRRRRIGALGARRHRRFDRDARLQLLAARRTDGRAASGSRFVRGDIAIAYVFTAIFGMAVMVVATQAFHVPGVAITNAQAVTRMAETLGATIGPVGFYAYAVGFWAAVFASLLGVWQSLPYLFADYYGLLRGMPLERPRAAYQR